MSHQRVAFLTDYGLADGFVAVCHGVVGRIAPEASVVDVSHLIRSQDVRHGAAVLARAVPYLAPCVVLAVVDPGVGTDRRAIAVEVNGSVLVGPDNGLLIPAAEALGGLTAAYALTNEELWLHPVSRTFHGRDIFAPVAAHIAAGIGLGEVGAEIAVESLVRLPAPRTTVVAGIVDAEVTYIDQYGNLQLSASSSDMVEAGITDAVKVIAGESETVVGVGGQFSDVRPGVPLVYTDSDGRLAIAVNQGSAAELFGARVGDRIRLTH